MKIKDRFLRFLNGKLEYYNPKHVFEMAESDILETPDDFMIANGFDLEKDIWQSFDWGSISGIWVNKDAAFMITISIDPAGHIIYIPSAADYLEFFRLYVTPGRCNIPYMDWRQDKMSNDPDFNKDAFDPRDSMTDTFKPDLDPVPCPNNTLDFAAIAKQECEAYLKKREAGRLEAYQKFLNDCGYTEFILNPLQYLNRRDQLISDICDYLIERDKPEGEDGLE